MIQIKKISKDYKKHFWHKPKRVLKDVSFEIEENQITGFLGANGAGKTTLLKILLGFIKQENGNISFDSILGKTDLDFKKNIGYLPERSFYYFHMKGFDFLKYMGELSGLDERTILEKSNEWGEFFNIKHSFNMKLSEFSKGMLQRIGLVSCMLHDPKVLILDEPFSGLDPIGKSTVRNALKDLHKLGKTIFFSTHDVNEVLFLCNKLVILKDGNVFYSGNTSDYIEKSSSHLIAKCSKNISGYEDSIINSTTSFLNYKLESSNIINFLESCKNENATLLSLHSDFENIEKDIYL